MREKTEHCGMGAKSCRFHRTRTPISPPGMRQQVAQIGQAEQRPCEPSFLSGCFFPMNAQRASDLRPSVHLAAEVPYA